METRSVIAKCGRILQTASVRPGHQSQTTRGLKNRFVPGRAELIMKRIEKAELYEHLSEFLKTKGIDLKEGSYTNFIHNGCKVLAEAVNLSQQGLDRARNGLNDKLDRMRRVIHEKTAPKPPPAGPAPNSAPAAGPTGAGRQPPATPPARRPRQVRNTKRARAGKGRRA